MVRNFYTSDHHFFHKNICRISNRPFDSLEHMHEELVTRWNSVVRPEDFVYVLGDFSFGKRAETTEIYRRLRGRKILVRGNHDPSHVAQLDWYVVRDLMEVREDGKLLVLCHYPMLVWNKSHHGAIQLHGHSHGSLPGTTQRCDVGVDCWNFVPVTLDMIEARMASLTPHVNMDHHGQREFERENERF